VGATVQQSLNDGSVTLSDFQKFTASDNWEKSKWSYWDVNAAGKVGRTGANFPQ
jgi:hypothetical protein